MVMPVMLMMLMLAQVSSSLALAFCSVDGSTPHLRADCWVSHRLLSCLRAATRSVHNASCRYISRICHRLTTDTAAVSRSLRLGLRFPFQGDVFMWIEILSASGTPRLKDFTTRVADAWLAVKLKDGTQAGHPHWAKWNDAYVAGADAKMKLAYASRLPYLRRAASKFDPNGVFVNKYFAKLFAP